VFLLKSGICYEHTWEWEAIAPSPYTLHVRSHFLQPSQKSFEQRTEMTFDLRLANITDPVVRDFYGPSTQNLMKKALYEITVNSQGWLNPFSHTFRSLATPQRHIITIHHLTPRRWRRTFLGTFHAIFNVQWDIFNNAISQGWPNCGSRTACGSLSFPKIYVFVFYLLFLLQSVEILWNGTVVARVSYTITFASRSKKIHDVTES